MSHDYSAIYDPDTDFDRHFTRLTAQRIRRWFRPGDRVLELGCATGLMTSFMAQADVTIDAVERVPAYLERARARELPNATFLDADVMEVDPPGPYNHVVAAHIVNELPDPVGFLRRFESFLAPGRARPHDGDQPGIGAPPRRDRDGPHRAARRAQRPRAGPGDEGDLRPGRVRGARRTGADSSASTASR